MFCSSVVLNDSHFLKPFFDVSLFRCFRCSRKVFLEGVILAHPPSSTKGGTVLELELIQTQLAQKPMLRAEVGMRVRCANKASAE